MAEELRLTDLVSVEKLQQLQDAFYQLTSLSMGVSDAEGNPITQHQACHQFCHSFHKKSKLGLERCRQCDVMGQRLAAENKGRPVIYHCHAGLMDFAAPIIVNDMLLGSFLGGQAADAPLEEEKLRSYAQELGVDPDAYVEASKQVPVYTMEEMEKLAGVLSMIANLITSMAFKRYRTKQESIEIVQEAKMKSDFLANMSHEIRTPMNAVIGMAEMALREKLPPAARQYISEIKTAGNSLLTIINDILDFSKISSGKMDITLGDYEPVSLVNDVVNIIATRIEGKNVELLVDYDPEIPAQLMGDSTRIKQIIMNLANNAVKFTREGRVRLMIGYKRTGEHEIILKAAVSDTGIGIKEQDLNRLFQSFQQVDSKRNRNIEGTGLGLAISKQLVELMNGSIRVESVYGKGSTFSFELPQITINDAASVAIEDERPIVAAVLSDNRFLQESLQMDITRFGGKCLLLRHEDELERLEREQAEFFFIDHPVFDDAVREYLTAHPKLTGVLMVSFGISEEYDIPNLIVAKKPLYSMNIGMIFNYQDLYGDEELDHGEKFDFVAPDAEILIVDDNEINLTVAVGLIEPFGMQIDTATSGREAVYKISEKHYDLVFMDHMMPEMDGVETTRVIRRFHPEYNDVPIIALTANVMEQTRTMFLVEGMNDFVAKPIEMKVMSKKLRQWLPKNKIRELTPEELREQDQRREEQQEEKPQETMSEELATIEREVGLDVKYSLSLLGSEKLFLNVLKDYYKVLRQKAKLINEYYEKKDWHNYAVEVHALKSASRQIGAIPLSELAAELERESKAGNEPFIEAHNSELVTQYLALGVALLPFLEVTNDRSTDAKISASRETVLALLDRMKSAIDELDMDGMQEVIEELSGYAFSTDQQILFEQLRQASELMDVDDCAQQIMNWESLL